MTAQTYSYLFFFIQCCLQGCVLASPILLWTNKNLPQLAVPFSTLSSLNLISDYICPLAHKHIELRLLAVNDLTLEDIQRGPHCEHPILLDAKKTDSKFRFYPNVENDAFEIFSSMPRSKNAKCSHINFDLISSKTHENLNDTLNILQTTIDTIGEDEDSTVLIALIGGPMDEPKLSRKRRQTTPIDNTALISNNNTCMFHAQSLKWNNVTGTFASSRNYSLLYNASSCQPHVLPDGNNQSVVLNLTWRNDQAPYDTIYLNLTVAIIGVYWRLVAANLNEKNFVYILYGMPDFMETPPNYSYICTTAVFIRYDPAETIYGQFNYSNKFFLDGLQFQPFNVNGDSFGNPNYCTEFFTRGIWMGITSSLICVAILLFGVCRIMAIKSNDRFDDPKGKPLIIKSEE